MLLSYKKLVLINKYFYYLYRKKLIYNIDKIPIEPWMTKVSFIWFKEFHLLENCLFISCSCSIYMNDDSLKYLSSCQELNLYHRSGITLDGLKHLKNCKKVHLNYDGDVPEWMEINRFFNYQQPSGQFTYTYIRPKLNILNESIS